MMFNKYFLTILIYLIAGNLLIQNIAFAQDTDVDNVNEQEERIKINLTQSQASEEDLPWLKSSDDNAENASKIENEGNLEEIAIVDDKKIENITTKLPIGKDALFSIYYKNNQYNYSQNDKQKLLEFIKSYSETEDNNVILKGFAYTKNDNSVANVRHKALKRVFEIRKYLVKNGVEESKINVFVYGNQTEENYDNNNDRDDDRIEIFLGV